MVFLSSSVRKAIVWTPIAQTRLIVFYQPPKYAAIEIFQRGLLVANKAFVKSH